MLGGVRRTRHEWYRQSQHDQWERKKRESLGKELSGSERGRELVGDIEGSRAREVTVMAPGDQDSMYEVGDGAGERKIRLN
jgi:hypothetical protein